MVAALLLAMSVWVSWPQFSQREGSCEPVPGVAAGIKRVKVYMINLDRSRTWVQLYGFTLARTGMWDGTTREYRVPPTFAAPGDSVGVFPTCIDEAGNWISRECERRIYFRVWP